MFTISIQRTLGMHNIPRVNKTGGSMQSTVYTYIYDNFYPERYIFSEPEGSEQQQYTI